MQNQLKEDLNDFLREKEELREVIGKIGGNNNSQAKIITTLFMGIVLVIFVTGIILKTTFTYDNTFTFAFDN